MTVVGVDKCGSEREIEPATESVDDLPEPVQLASEIESGSSALERLRRHER